MALVKYVLLAAVALQLLSCQISTATSDFPFGESECSAGFPDQDDFEESELVSLPDRSLPPEDILFNFVQWVFPSVNFTCSGNISEWILNVNTTSTPSQNVHRPIPQISTWRISFKLDDMIIYEQQSITNETQASVTVTDDYVYHYTLSEPVEVQSGDIVGIMMPRTDEENRRSVRPFFLKSPGGNLSAFSCVERGNRRTVFIYRNEQPCGNNPQTVQLQRGYVPQIRVIIDHVETSPTVTPSPTPVPFTSTQSFISLTPTPTTIPTTTEDRVTTEISTTDETTVAPTLTGAADMSTLTVGVVVGAIVAAIALVLIVLLVILLVVMLCRRRRERQKLYDVPTYAQPQNLDNPVYTTDYNGSTNHSNGVYATPSPTQITSPHPLETDIVAEHYEFSPDTVPPINEHQYELEPAEQDEPAYQDPVAYAVPSVNVPKAGTMSQPYEIPLSALSTLNSTRDESSLDRHIYSVLEGGIYVPTEEERRFLSQSVKSSKSVATSNGGTGTGVFDDNIYARMSKKYKNRLDEGQFFEQEEVYWKPASSQTALYHQLAKKKYREILRQQIHIIKHLGSGQFGTVSKGLWESPYGSTEVAVKMLQPQARKEEKVKFLQEAAIMGQFLHPNIVKLHGVVTVDQPVMIVLEYMKNGDLREYLLAQRPKEGELAASDLPQRFLKFCREIASGMNYLSNKAFVHRDLAARNILVSEDEICKIGDFGMSRDLEDNNYYITHGGKIPVKWTAPEALHFRKYSTASDVWSFGCVMYEIWSLGHKPFDAYSNIQAMQMIGSGYRLPPPPGCPKPLYSLMIRCWHSDATVRPMFSAIFKMLSHSDSHLLNWSDQDRQVHPQASYLGAPLEAGDELYTDLQDYYLDEPSKRQ